MKLIDILQRDSTPFVIYGAQVVAYGAYKAIRGLCGRKPECFVVSSLEGNPKEIENIPVDTLEGVPRNTLVVVGVTELLQKEILSRLKEKNYQNVFVLTQHEEYLLMSQYFAGNNIFPVAGKADREGPFPVDLVMYGVCNHRDKPLKSPPRLEPFEVPIQAGAALAHGRAARLQDNTGENISQKNQQYCEMTAVYWVWKNSQHEWTGIEHYRRRLLVEPGMLTGGIDAILPLPYICYPNTVAQFRRFVSEDVFQALLRALKALYPKEYDSYQKILYGPYQYTYNLVCAKRPVFCDYCQWFFSITEYMETMGEDVPEIKHTRALSYVAEALTNLYFMYNRNRWNIQHTEKAIYV